MNKDLIEIGEIDYKYGVHSILGYQVKVYHKGLNEKKILSAPEKYLLRNKVDIQIQKWNEKWNRGKNIEAANLKTKEVENDLNEIENLLIHTLSIDDTIQWHKLKDRRKFTEKGPAEFLEGTLNNITRPVKDKITSFPLKQERNHKKFRVKLTFFDKLSSLSRQKKEMMANDKYMSALKSWERRCNEIIMADKKNKDDYKQSLADYERMRKYYIEENRKQVDEWEKRKEEFLRNQNEYNSKIDQLKDSYLSKQQNAIIEYCRRVLTNSEYPDSFPQNFELEYNPTNGILIVEYELPSIECFPNVKEVKYIAARKELKEYYISDALLNKMFDDAIYKITLRTVHELFEADKADAINAISFNGWVNAINKATGKLENNCIVSIQVRKNEFLEMDLSNVDPKICFRNLKGVASSKLSTLTPIQPILKISRADRRFRESYSVTTGMDSTTNLAAMDWEDFEHLIRELFEKEFKSQGGEVKVTQASRDGGVDAIAFDPDPIRGGKIVIQAKRYTNTVGVSAVRDLYGTVLNEGATKGILVSTADYGADAYEFAKGKPITLLNGSNLLHLLEKHGHHAKIDLREAKKILSDKSK